MLLIAQFFCCHNVVAISTLELHLREETLNLPIKLSMFGASTPFWTFPDVVLQDLVFFDAASAIGTSTLVALTWLIQYTITIGALTLDIPEIPVLNRLSSHEYQVWIILLYTKKILECTVERSLLGISLDC